MKNTTMIHAAVLLLLGSAVTADQVVFTNGDRLTGEVTQLIDGTLTIKTELAGTVKVGLAGVQSFTCEKPLKILLTSGEMISAGSARAGGDGKVQVDYVTDAAPTNSEAGYVGGRTIALADIESINPPPVKWTGSLMAGAIVTRGNTESESYNVDFKAVRNTKADRTTVEAGYYFGRQKDKDTGKKTTSADNWMASAKYDRFFTEKFYGYAAVKAKHDRLADLDMRLTPGVGCGYQWFRGDKMNLGTEAGLSWVYEKYRDPSRTERYFAGRLAYNFDRKLGEDVTVFHNLEYLPSLEAIDTYLINTDAGIKIKINAHLFTELKSVLNYNSQPAAGTDKTDIKYMANIGVTF